MVAQSVRGPARYDLASTSELRFVQRITLVLAAKPPHASPRSTDSVARWDGCGARAAIDIHGLQWCTSSSSI